MSILKSPNIKVTPQSSSNSQFDFVKNYEALRDIYLKSISSSIHVPRYLIEEIKTERLRTFRQEYQCEYIEHMRSSFLDKELLKILEEGPSLSYQWENFYLYKHDSDEPDGDGGFLQVYSIISRYNWKSGIKIINEDPDSYGKYANSLPKDMFVEVAANWFELLVDEEELPEGLIIVK